ncbi:MAG: hypothetical protein FWB99_03535 [Treponema sp.]|nr:hypothetical protein [Treponema sp.]
MAQARETLSRMGYNVVGSGSRSNSGMWWTDIAKHNGWLIQQNDVFGQHRILGPGDECYATIKDEHKMGLLLKAIIDIGDNLEQQKRAELEKAREWEREEAEAKEARAKQKREAEEKRKQDERKAKEAAEQRRIAAEKQRQMEEESQPATCRACGAPLKKAGAPCHCPG